jgi:hypothetical protein
MEKLILYNSDTLTSFVNLVKNNEHLMPEEGQVQLKEF